MLFITNEFIFGVPVTFDLWGQTEEHQIQILISALIYSVFCWQVNIARARARAHLARGRETWPLTASNDLGGQIELAYDTSGWI